MLEAYPWPGNVRELENTMQRAAVLATADVLLPKDIPLGLPTPGASPQAGEVIGLPDKERALEALFQIAADDPALALLPWIEREFTLRALREAEGNPARAAKLLGITAAALRKQIARNGTE